MYGRTRQDTPSIVRVGVKLAVSDLPKMRTFYQESVGMLPTRSGSSFVTFNDVLALTASRQPEATQPARLSVYLEVQNLDLLWRRIEEAGAPIIDPLGTEAGRRRFRCLDPEGNILEAADTDHRQTKRDHR